LSNKSDKSTAKELMGTLLSSPFKIEGKSEFKFFVNISMSEYYAKIEELGKIREKLKIMEDI